MRSFSNTYGHTAARLLNYVFAGVSGAASLFYGVKTCAVRESVPADFTPVIRFAVCSDIHLSTDEKLPQAIRLGQLFDVCRTYADQNNTYHGFDAVLVVGDFATSGDPAEFQLFNDIVSAHKRDGTQVLAVLGNHEFIKYRDNDASVAYSVFREYICKNVDRHDVINGYHFIGVSYDDDGRHFKTKRNWLCAQLDAATAETPDRPVFVYQHPAPLGTIYGSISWSDRDIRKVLDNYPQAVDFSGHSHLFSGDPRSIWQGVFTAIGSGSLAAYMGNLNYISGDQDAPGKSGGFWLAEADANGNVRLQLYDSETRTFFQNAQTYLTGLCNKKQRTHTWWRSMALDTAPVFPENADIRVKTDEKGEVVLCFPDAAGYYAAEHYKITVSDINARIVWEDTVLSGYVRAGQTETETELGALLPGEYRVAVTAYSPYAKKGRTLKKTVRIEST